MIMIIEQVVVKNPEVKSLRKGNTEENSFQRAAHMISSLIRVQRCAKEWSGKKGPKKKDDVVVYLCRACDMDTHCGKKSPRQACVEHLETFHRNSLHSWAGQLGMRQDDKQFLVFLFKALAPGFMFRAM